MVVVYLIVIDGGNSIILVVLIVWLIVCRGEWMVINRRWLTHLRLFVLFVLLVFLFVFLPPSISCVPCHDYLWLVNQKSSTACNLLTISILFDLVLLNHDE